MPIISNLGGVLLTRNLPARSSTAFRVFRVKAFTIATSGDVSLAGGANAAQQYLRAGLVDEMEIHLVPILLGAGEQLFEGVKDVGGLKLVRTVAVPKVTHLRFARRSPADRGT